ncbi:hypothetical protein FDP41_012427 [Naegleria fowleri]|uniref:Rhodanese domain-containing protein n=1 Tax=Naegleria fowleri TaxID=5763 RepID=A0A6A5C7L4_NAEFO|nr:uncharacterized protein FDP41_012427 [Naegleria fowleri]KAF0981770.1 hypothetical protein FDP41_012427 [Naegleria fowleri]CAG4714112.1 unnamed protein product [Naegleria fowleri]
MSSSTDHGVSFIEPKQLADLIKTKPQNLMIIDVRDADFEGGNIKSAQNIPYFDEEKARELALRVYQHNSQQQNQPKLQIRAKQLLNELHAVNGGVTKYNTTGSDDHRIYQVIFNCYYCRMRGPTAAKLFQTVLQEVYNNQAPPNNVHGTSVILLPEIKFVKGGWSAWKRLYKNDPTLCDNCKQLDKFIKAVRK